MGAIVREAGPSTQISWTPKDSNDQVSLVKERTLQHIEKQRELLFEVALAAQAFYDATGTYNPERYDHCKKTLATALKALEPGA